MVDPFWVQEANFQGEAKDLKWTPIPAAPTILGYWAPLVVGTPVVGFSEHQRGAKRKAKNHSLPIDPPLLGG